MEVIRPIRDETEARTCAAMMASTDPWITLQRGFDACLRAVSESARETYVAVDDDVVRGVIVLDMRGTFSGYIATVCVDAATRSAGLGTRLVHFAEERIFREKPNVFLCVSSFNTRARALYERLGYERVGELRDFLLPGHDEVLMRKSIGPISSSVPGSSVPRGPRN